MSLYKFTSGVNTSFSTELNSNHSVALRELGRSLVRQLQDRSVNFSADGGEWAEAYSDSNGQKNSVDTSLTTAWFDTDNYSPGVSDEAGSDTTHDPDSMTNPSYSFDGDISTYASISASGSTQDWSLGKTFSAKTVNIVHYKVYGSIGNSWIHTIKLQTYDGSSWNDETIIDSSSGSRTTQGSYVLNSSVQGIRINFTGNGGSSDSLTFRVYSLEYGDMSSSSLVTHNIPTGTYSSTISSCFGTALLSNWEEGDSIQYKLTNTTEDTGWLDYNELSTFTAFTSEPTKCIVKLIPKTTSPTAGYPSIKGFSVFE